MWNFSLVGGDVTGCFGNLSHNLLVPTSLGSTRIQHIVTILQLGGGFDSPTKMYHYVQSILKEINPEYPLEGLMLKLKLQYFGRLICRADSLGKTLMLGKIEGRRRGRQRTRWLDGITNIGWMSLSKPRETVKDREALHAAVHGVAKSQT